MRILLLSGGMSAEHEVSLVSGDFVSRVLEASGHQVMRITLHREGSWLLEGKCLSIVPGAVPWRLQCLGETVPFDIVFPVLHGPWGEDGTVQGLCGLAGWPCAGAGIMTSSLAMNKVATRRLASAEGIRVLPWKSFSVQDSPEVADVSELGYPLFVKPARLGSSVGISRVEGPEDLGPALESAFSYDRVAVVEKGLESPREIEVSLLGESGGVSSSIPGEVVPGMKWYSYEAKYSCPDSRLLIPAPVPDATATLARDWAERCLRAMDGRGFARADFLLDRENGTLYFNEINTIPGFTGISMFAKLWEASGLPPDRLLGRILEEALERFSGGKVPD